MNALSYIHPQIRSVGMAFGSFNLLIKTRSFGSHVLPTSGRSDTLTYNNGKRILSLPTPLLLVRFSDKKTWKEFIKHNLTQQIFTYLNSHLISWNNGNIHGKSLSIYALLLKTCYIIQFTQDIDKCSVNSISEQFYIWS